MKIYCLKCKTATETAAATSSIAKNGRPRVHGQCALCGCGKSKFVKMEGKGLINNFINDLPFEMHYPGHNFLGPGTKLNKRLNEDQTPESWSVPVDSDDAVAYRHDLCYLKNKDRKTRNAVCDKNMLDELASLTDQTPAEKKHAKIASAIIGTKKRLGLGLKKTVGLMN